MILYLSTIVSMLTVVKFYSFVRVWFDQLGSASGAAQASLVALSSRSFEFDSQSSLYVTPSCLSFIVLHRRVWSTEEERHEQNKHIFSFFKSAAVKCSPFTTKDYALFLIIHKHI